MLALYLGRMGPLVEKKVRPRVHFERHINVERLADFAAQPAHEQLQAFRPGFIRRLHSAKNQAPSRFG
jgi:hypothetical protein